MSDCPQPFAAPDAVASITDLFDLARDLLFGADRPRVFVDSPARLDGFD